MSDQFQKNIDYYLNSDLKSLLTKTECGLELESLRTDKKGEISQRPHPEELGSPLFHPNFTNDFSKAQLEYTTAKYKSNKLVVNALRNLIAFAHQNIGNEMLWPLAMPPPLDHLSKEVIASFGFTPLAEEKELYRKGLMHRYGPEIQMISGVHYNFSFSNEFFKADHSLRQEKTPLKNFISNQYLHLMRHYIKNTYLMVYLFGASPTAHKTYTPLKQSLNHATSLRMSRYGYHSPHQCQLKISYNDFDGYCKSYEKELGTPCAAFKSIEEQLNSFVLQNESELYVPIRAKGSIHCKNATLESIKHCGIAYVEVRTLDINPFEPTGVALEDLEFLRLFLIYCLIKPSQKLTHSDIQEARLNQHHIATAGRKPGVRLQNRKSFKKAALETLYEVAQIAKHFKLESVVERQIARVENPQTTLSGQIASKPFLKFGLETAAAHQKYFTHYSVPEKLSSKLQKEAKKSLVTQSIEDAKARFTLKGYESLEKSTQVVIREAKKRGIQVTILDPRENFLLLEKEGKREFIKEATKTAYDSYVSPLMMENKQLSKKLLKENQINTPEGIHFFSIEDAIQSYSRFEHRKVVIKPNTSNFGIGIHFIEPGCESYYKAMLKEAFRHSKSVIVEDHFSGEEYRFLVIQGKVIGVVKRVPAHIIGDGKSTINQLIRQKNRDPRYYKDRKTSIKMHEEERLFLKKQHLHVQSIPKKDECIFLRDNSNVSTGGDSIDVTDEVHEDFKEIAIKAAQSANANICGVDIMIRNKEMRATSDNYTVIEINYNPMLALHEFPVAGKPRDTASPLLDLLGF